MALREKFGRLVLLEQTDSDPLGDEYRAARLGPQGFDRLVSVLRFSGAVSGNAEASKRVEDEARRMSQLQNPGLVRVLGLGRVNQSFYVSTELAEGRTVRAILSLCAEEGFPFAVDHALMIASRAAAGLEYLHGRKDENGHAFVHGLLTPGRLVVAFDGEVKVKGLGLWPALGTSGLLAPEECLYLAPEQATGTSEPRSDVYALGLVLLEALCAQPPDGNDPLERIASARIASPGSEPVALPKPLVTLLRRALGREPGSRYTGIAEMRKAIDALLFSGDFTPTTFDLAFFMHTLFRDEVEKDTRAIDDARAADYQAFLADDAAKPSALPPTEPAAAGSSGSDANDALGAMPTAVSPATAADPQQAPAAHGSRPASGPDSSGARHARVSRDSPARDALPRGALGATAPRAGLSRSLGLVLGLVGAVVLGGGAGWLYFLAQRRAAASSAASAEQTAAQARVHELETRIAQLEKEKAEAEARAAEEARKAIEQQAAAGGRSADPAAVARAQEEARQRARGEQERKQQQELVRLAEAKRAEEQRAVAAAAAQTAPATPVTPAPTPLPTPTPAQAAPGFEPSPVAPPAAGGPADQAASPAQTPGATPSPAGTAQAATPPAGSPTPASARHLAVDPNDPGVRPPGLISEEAVPYPARAVAYRIAAVVVVRALVDETGRVVEAAIVQSSGQPADYGFDQAALSRVKSRKYRPARRNDVPVPIWVVVRVEFRPPPR